MKKINRYALICIMLLFFTGSDHAKEEETQNEKTVESAYPHLASGILTFARLCELPEGVLMRAETVEIKVGEIEKIIAETPAPLQEQLKENAFFVLEGTAASHLLLYAAGKEATDGKTDLSGKADSDIIEGYLGKVVEKVVVTDVELEKFYQENKDMFGGATLDQSLKKQIREYVLSKKRQDVVLEHMRTFGQRMPIFVSSAWTREQAVLAKDNPVDIARNSGKPSLVDFGADGCQPCEMMTPILAALRKKYEGQLNVLFVHVRENQILAARYNIQSIPVQVFFDKDGREAFRHIGFYPQNEIEKKLSAMGIK